MSVRLLTIKISEWAREDSAVIVKIPIDTNTAWGQKFQIA